jgi:serine/threonine protein kinase
MTCPPDDTLIALVERTLSPAMLEELELHISSCDDCRRAIGHLAATGDTQPADHVGRYRLDRMLGSGGMGVVWQAWDSSLERSVALKLLHDDAGAEGKARLLREARALAKLQHPNVIAVYDAGELGGEVYIATELVDGESLDRWARGRDAREVIAVYAQAARGLAAAHAIGLVHRDVKPANILVARDGRARIGDFGLVAIRTPEGRASEPKLTSTGHVVGTPMFMAPEQRDGRAIDARVDQYSLCRSLVESLGDVPGASAGRDGVLAPWDAITRGLAPLASGRFPDMTALAVELEAFNAPPRSSRRVMVLILALAVIGAAAIAYAIR